MPALFLFCEVEICVYRYYHRLKNYDGSVFDLRLSNYLHIKQVIHIAWQAKQISLPKRDGGWVRVVNKKAVFSGEYKLSDCGITTGDRLEIL